MQQCRKCFAKFKYIASIVDSFTFWWILHFSNNRCPCGEFCSNRKFQEGQKVHIEAFKTEKKGWGLRTLEDISAWVLHLYWICLSDLNCSSSNVRGLVMVIPYSYQCIVTAGGTREQQCLETSAWKAASLVLPK